MQYWKVKPEYAGKIRGEDGLPLIANELYTTTEWLHFCNLVPLTYAEEIDIHEFDTYYIDGSRYGKEVGNVKRNKRL